ncbi:MAG: carboxypeptidase regulatory-like domain-containing protein, partial [Opitutaceae bacterium]
MTIVHPLLRLVFVTCLCLAHGVRAQAPATGSITGRVQNAATGDYLNNARVAVKGTALTTLTEEGGFFRIVGVPVGPASLRVSFNGLDDREVALTVTDGQTATADVRLTRKSRSGDSAEAI